MPPPDDLSLSHHYIPKFCKLSKGRVKSFSFIPLDIPLLPEKTMQPLYYSDGTLWMSEKHKIYAYKLLQYWYIAVIYKEINKKNWKCKQKSSYIRGSLYFFNMAISSHNIILQSLIIIKHNNWLNSIRNNFNPLNTWQVTWCML